MDLQLLIAQWSGAARIRSIRHPQDRPRPARGNTRCGGDLPSSATTPPQNACQWRSVRRTASCRRRRAHPSPRGAASPAHTGRAERDSSESGAATTATSSARRRDRTLSTLPQSTSSRPGPTRCARATGLRRVALERKAEAGALSPPLVAAGRSAVENRADLALVADERSPAPALLIQHLYRHGRGGFGPRPVSLPGERSGISRRLWPSSRATIVRASLPSRAITDVEKALTGKDDRGAMRQIGLDRVFRNSWITSLAYQAPDWLPTKGLAVVDSPDGCDRLLIRSDPPTPGRRQAEARWRSHPAGRERCCHFAGHEARSRTAVRRQPTNEARPDDQQSRPPSPALRPQHRTAVGRPKTGRLRA